MSVIFQKHMPEAFFEILLFWPTICRGYFGPILYFHISNRFKAWTLKARFLGENILIGAAKVGAGRQRHSGPFSIWCQICRRGFRHQRGFRRHRHRVPYGQCHWSADPLIRWSTDPQGALWPVLLIQTREMKQTLLALSGRVWGGRRHRFLTKLKYFFF